MATQGQTNNKKTKTGPGGFPTKVKSFVQNMKSFRKDFIRWRGAKNGADKPKQPSPSQVSTPTIEEDVPVSEIGSSFRDSRHVRSLNVRVTVSFGEPLNYAHTQDYEGSSLLQPTEELCEALIRRVDHCSKELITRRDSSALDRTGSDGLAKPLKYEIQLQVLRNEAGTGTEAWASRTLRSYQRQPLGTETAREVILSTHYMVGLFLRHHDEAFVWKDGPVREDAVQEQKTFPYRPGRVQPLTSIPRSFFIEKQQDFESIPGYTISLSFTSQNHHRTPRRWHETVEVHSHQLSPLTLATAENLFLDACHSVDGVFKEQRKSFESLQRSCASHSGCQHCRPQDGDGVEMMLSVKNNVGPLFDNLERTTSTSINVFWKDHATDCVEFVEKAKAAIVQVCRDTDEAVTWMNDFEFYIIELRGRGWTIEEPLAFTLGPETCLCRRTVESLLDRLQTSVADVLRGNAIAVRMTARKRGHFILHKTLVAREPIEKPGSKKTLIEKTKAYVLDRLKQRIDRDIDMVCKDTCTIVGQDMETSKPDRTASAPSHDYASMHTGLMSSKRLSNLTAPSRKSATNQPNSSADRLESRGSELLETPELSSTSLSNPDRLWSKVARDPATGARQFPLVPDRRASYPVAGTSSREPASRQNKFRRYDTTTTSLDLSSTHEQAESSATQTSSASSTSNTGRGSAETSLTGSHNYGREKHVAAGSTTSTRPRTPDLEFSGSPSVRSSVLITPKVPGPALSNEVGTAGKPAPEVEVREDNGSVPSVISEARPVADAQRLNDLGGDDIPSLKTEVPSQPRPEPDGPSSVKPTDNIVRADPIKEHGTTTGKGQCFAHPPERAEEDVFAQSKPDFDFTTSSEGSEAIDGASPPADMSNIITITPSQQQDGRDTTNHDPSEKDDEFAIDSSPSGRSEHLGLHKRHSSRSFSSAGYLGSFNEQGFYGVGLRRALAGASTPPPRPFSRLSFRSEEEEEQGRPGTAI